MQSVHRFAPPLRRASLLRPATRLGLATSLRQLVSAGALLLAGCMGLPVADLPAGTRAETPRYAVGERWVYRAQDGYLRPVTWEEIHEVIRADADGIEIRVTQRGPGVDADRVERLRAPGEVQVGAVFDAESRAFDPTLLRYDFPLAPGKTWNQWLHSVDQTTGRAGDINRYVRVGGWRRIATPAGSFDAIALTVAMHLDDGEFWRDPTDCTYQLWYAPAVGAVVRADKEAQYYEKSGKLDSGPILSQHARLELVAHTAAR